MKLSSITFYHFHCSVIGENKGCRHHQGHIGLTSVVTMLWYTVLKCAHSALVTAHRDDITFLTPGSSPACETVAEEVTLFVLAAHRTSRMTGRWGALVWNIFEQEKERERESIVLLRKRSEESNYNISNSTDLATFQKNNKIICLCSLTFDSFLRIISFHSARVCVRKRALTHFCSSPFSFPFLVVKFKVYMPRLVVACCWAVCKRKKAAFEENEGTRNSKFA